jgi:ECF transporter S component (folate family)
MVRTKSGVVVFPLQKLMVLSLLVALSIVIKRFLGFNVAFLSVSLGFLPIAAAGMLFGPAGGTLAAVTADVVGALLFPFGVFNLGFTVSAALSGLCYGYFMHKPAPGKRQIMLCQLLISLFLHLLLNTVLVIPYLKSGFWGSLPLRIVKNVLMYPIEVMLLGLLQRYRPRFERLLK